MSTRVPDRISWAVEVLDVQPDDIILEIGSGNGIAASIIGEKLETGRIIAIDRSARMTSTARERNSAYISQGKVEVQTVELNLFASHAAAFDKIFVFNLNVFWMDPAAELGIVRRLLKSGGEFFIFHQPPPGSDLEEFADAISKNLTRNCFVPEDAIYNRSVSSLCVRSRPAAENDQPPIKLIVLPG
jgi:ubiquinone/menaquinone biosynthesis C-methylase UbiE